MKLQFSPVNIDGAHIHRQILKQAAPTWSRVTRAIWRRSSAAKSTFNQDTILWRWLWQISRYIACLPRVTSCSMDVQLDQRVRMRLDLARLNDAFVLIYGIGECEIGEVCRLFCLTDSVALDIGANVGSTALAFAEVLLAGTVHAFEPAPAIREVLTTNIELAHFTNVVVHPYGLSDVPLNGRLEIAMKGNPGSAYFIPDESNPEVELRTLDDVFTVEERIDFVKIDVEGFEYRVLCGGRRLIATQKPVLIVEMNNYALVRSGASHEMVEKLLADWGYRFFYLDRGRLRCCEPERLSSYPGIYNLIAVHPRAARLWQVVESHNA